MVAFTVNGVHRELGVDPNTPLLWVLREHLKLTGTKFGCGVAVVRRLHGAYRRQADACLHHADVAWSRAHPSPPSKGFRPTAAIRCRRPGSPSRCRNAATASPARSCRPPALLARNKTPTRAEIVEHMDGNICRCGTYLQNHQRDPARGAGGLSHDRTHRPTHNRLSRRDFLSAAAGLTLALTVTPDPLAILGVEDPSGTAKAEAALSPNVWLTIVDRRHDHHRLAGRRDGTRHVHHAAGDYRRRARRRLGNGASRCFRPSGTKGNTVTRDTTAMRSRPPRVSRSAAISRRCASRARRHGACCIDAVAAKWSVPVARAFDRAQRRRAQGHRAAASPMARSRALPRRRPNCRRSKRRTSKPPRASATSVRIFRGSKCRSK